MASSELFSLPEEYLTSKEKSSSDLFSLPKEYLADTKAEEDLSSDKPQEQPSPAHTVGKSFLAGLIPSTAGIAGMAAGASAAGAAMRMIPTPPTQIAATALQVIGGLTGALVTGGLVAAAQNKLWSMVSPEGYLAWQKEQAANPKAAITGSVLSGLPLMSPRTVASAATAATSPLIRGVTSPIGQRAVGGGLGGAIDIGTQLAETGKVDPYQLGANVVAGAAFPNLNRPGHALYKGVENRMPGAKVDPQVTPKPEDVLPEPPAPKEELRASQTDEQFAADIEASIKAKELAKAQEDALLQKETAAKPPVEPTVEPIVEPIVEPVVKSTEELAVKPKTPEEINKELQLLDEEPPSEQPAVEPAKKVASADVTNNNLSPREQAKLEHTRNEQERTALENARDVALGEGNHADAAFYDAQIKEISRNQMKLKQEMPEAVVADKEKPTWEEVQDITWNSPTFGHAMDKVHAAGVGTRGQKFLLNILRSHKLVRSAGIEHRTDYIPPEEVGAKVGSIVYGMYDPGPHMVTLAKGADLQGMLHEAVHAATWHIIEAGGTHAKALKALFEKYKAQAEGRDAKRYGFATVHEFVTEAMNNPDFARHLDGIKSSEIGYQGGLAGKVHTLWSEFKGIIQSALGADKVRITRTALDDVLDHGSTLIEATKEQGWNDAKGEPTSKAVASLSEVKLPEYLKDKTPEEHTKEGADRLGERLNPKIKPLVEALNKRGVYTHLSGDLYDNKLVYVDVLLPYTKVQRIHSQLNKGSVDRNAGFKRIREDWFITRPDAVSAEAAHMTSSALKNKLDELKSRFDHLAEGAQHPEKASRLALEVLAYQHALGGTDVGNRSIVSFPHKDMVSWALKQVPDYTWKWQTRMPVRLSRKGAEPVSEAEVQRVMKVLEVILRDDPPGTLYYPKTREEALRSKADLSKEPLRLATTRENRVDEVLRSTEAPKPVGGQRDSEAYKAEPDAESIQDANKFSGGFKHTFWVTPEGTFRKVWSGDHELDAKVGYSGKDAVAEKIVAEKIVRLSGDSVDYNERLTPGQRAAIDDYLASRPDLQTLHMYDVSETTPYKTKANPYFAPKPVASIEESSVLPEEVKKASAGIDVRSIANEAEFKAKAEDIYKTEGKEAAVEFFRAWKQHLIDEVIPVTKNIGGLADNLFKVRTWKQADLSAFFAKHLDFSGKTKESKAQADAIREVAWRLREGQSDAQFRAVLDKVKSNPDTAAKLDALTKELAAGDKEVAALIQKGRKLQGDDRFFRELETGQARYTAPKKRERTLEDLFGTKEQSTFGTDIAETPSAMRDRSLFMLEDGTVIQIENPKNVNFSLVKSWKDGKPSHWYARPIDTATGARTGRKVPKGDYVALGPEGKRLTAGDTITAFGKEQKIMDAPTHIIEAHTPYRYIKDAQAVQYMKLMELRNTVRTLELIESLKESSFLGTAKGPDTPQHEIPKGYKVPSNIDRVPQLRGWMFDPKTAAVIEDFAKIWEPTTYLKVTSMLIKNMMLNPIPHMFNELAHLWNLRGLSGWVTPAGLGRLNRSLPEAWKIVSEQTDKYQEIMREGGALLGVEPRANKYFNDIGVETIKNTVKEPAIKEALKKIGFSAADFYNAWSANSSKAMWVTRDVMYVQAILEAQKLGAQRGTPLSIKDAIAKVGEHMPEYRMPTEIAGSRMLSQTLQNPYVAVFSRYHYGMVKSILKTIQAVDPRNLKTEKGKQEFKDGIDSMMAIGVAMAVMYPLMDYLAEQVFGKGAHMRRAGPYHLLEGVQKTVTGEKDASAMLWPTFTFNPVLLVLGQLAVNKQLFSGKPVYHPEDPVLDKAKDAGKYLANSVPQIGTVGRAYNQSHPEGFIGRQLDVQVKSPEARRREEKAIQIRDRNAITRARRRLADLPTY